MKRILVATDLSTRSGLALHRAGVLAHQFDASIEMVTVVEELFFDTITNQKAELAHDALDAQIKATPGTEGLAITRYVGIGTDYERVLRRAISIDADLIVVGPHRHAASEMFFGTTAERIVRHGTIPVLVARTPATGPYQASLVASDLSRHAEVAIKLGATLTPQASITVLHAVQRSFGGFLDESSQADVLHQDINKAHSAITRTLESAVESLGDQAPSTNVITPEGDAADAITAAIDDLKVDLLVMGTHGRSGPGHAILGSLAGEFLASSPIDVLAVKAND